MIRKFLCFIGLHEKKYTRQIAPSISEYRCVNCKNNFICQKNHCFKKDKIEKLVKSIETKNTSKNSSKKNKK